MYCTNTQISHFVFKLRCPLSFLSTQTLKMKNQPRSLQDLNSPLQLSAQCLIRRDFTGCRNNAHKSKQLHPDDDGAHQILAVADILEAAEDRVIDNNYNWYSILKITPNESKNRDLVRDKFRKLKDDVKFFDKREFEFVEVAFDLIRKAFLVLYNEKKRSHYEIEIVTEEPPKKRLKDDDIVEEESGKAIDEEAGTANLGVDDDSFQEGDDDDTEVN